MPQTVSIPLVCETLGCANRGEIVNTISEYPAEFIEAFYEDYDGSEPEDVCPMCGEPAIAQDPVME